ncbi:MAG: DUF4298 domain-containing protein [Lachnospiraceae bacterium]|nr:DUF4298 domain-containing protein [Lachnospiraceae bacterium]MBR6303113.1 DUF4298 domain-containing protein [Lachnospiraceae bacterium]
MSDNRIKRITEMEAAMDKVSKVLDGIHEKLSELKKLTGDIDKLEEYYENEWRDDFDADERGELPGNLKRGVLTEDALYELLEEVERYMDYV